MGSLADHASTSITKLLIIGDAKAGKTGSLVALVKAGYKLFILDYDNLLDILSYMIRQECPEFIGNVQFRSLRDKRKQAAGGWVIDGTPRAFSDGLKMLDNWKYTEEDGTEIDFGRPADWGPDCVLVLDSLSRFCDAAYDWALAMAGPKMDGRAVYGDAQDGVENVLAGLTSPRFNTNLIIIAHVAYMQDSDGKTKGFPQGVGQKLSPKIPQYFPSVVHYKNSGGKRTLQTVSTSLMDLANPRPYAMEKEYPIETGLAQFFGVLQDPPNPESPRAAVTTPAPTTPNLNLNKPNLMRR